MSVVSASPLELIDSWNKRPHPDQLEDYALTRNLCLSTGDIKWTVDSLERNLKEGQTDIR